jgi:hypothetical protein
MATVYPQRQLGRTSTGVDGTVWQYTPPTLTQVTSVPGTTPALGTAIAVTPTTVMSSAGFWYVMTTTAGVSTLLQSTGTTQAGITGHAYLLTWS